MVHFERVEQNEGTDMERLTVRPDMGTCYVWSLFFCLFCLSGYPKPIDQSYGVTSHFFFGIRIFEKTTSSWKATHRMSKSQSGGVGV